MKVQVVVERFDSDQIAVTIFEEHLKETAKRFAAQIRKESPDSDVFLKTIEVRKK